MRLRYPEQAAVSSGAKLRAESVVKMKNFVALFLSIMAFCMVAGPVGAAPAAPSHEAGDQKERKTTRPGAGETPGVAAKVPEKLQARPWPKWLYNEWRDRANESPTRYAELLSDNSVQVRAQQGAHTRLAITLRSGPEGDDVILTLSKGRFECVRSYCQLMARFDNGAFLVYTGAALRSENANAILLNEYSSFLRQIRKASSLVIRAELEQEGSRDFAFDTVGLRWP